MICEEQKQFKVELEDNEKDDILKAIKIIQDAVKTAERKDCTSFDFGYPESPEYLNIDNLKTTASILESFTEIHTME